MNLKGIRLVDPKKKQTLKYKTKTLIFIRISVPPLHYTQTFLYTRLQESLHFKRIN